MPTRTRRRTATRRRTTTSRRRTYRRGRSVASTLGAAAATAAVALLLDASWPIKIALVLVALIAAAGWFVWTHRQQIAADARAAEVETAAQVETQAEAHET